MQCVVTENVRPLHSGKVGSLHTSRNTSSKELLHSELWGSLSYFYYENYTNAHEHLEAYKRTTERKELLKVEAGYGSGIDKEFERKNGMNSTSISKASYSYAVASSGTVSHQEDIFYPNAMNSTSTSSSSGLTGSSVSDPYSIGEQFVDDSRTPIPAPFEHIFKQLKAKEKKGYQAARDFASSSFALLPNHLHWRLYLEMADIAKRENMLKDAREFYQKATVLHPHASQAWLEYAKLEEECGQLLRCQKILKYGLMYCPYNEGLLIKAIKLEEKICNYSNARSILSRMQYVPIDKAWRIILEGALFESRVGNIFVARKIFRYLMKNAPGYGNIFQEACLLEERYEEYHRAIEIAEKGLEENPRYGPLYLTVLRLYEKIAHGDLTRTREVVERAVKLIPKELRWKIYYEAAQIEDRAGNLELAREAYVKSVYHCPNNLLWKVWLAGARTELRANSSNCDIARRLIHRSLHDVPEKKKAQVWLEWARLEEFIGNVDQARQVLKQARKEAKHEWKVFLETILLEIRSNNVKGAIAEAKEALKIHTGTGRLWALLINLQQIEGEEEQLKVFRDSLQEVPKSGEVWCEGARIYLCNNNLVEARRFLDFAIHFTPQFGDSFIEYLRLELLENGRNADLSRLEQLCVNAEPNYGTLWMYCKQDPLYSTKQVLHTARELLLAEMEGQPNEVLSLHSLELDINKLKEQEKWRLIFGPESPAP